MWRQDLRNVNPGHEHSQVSESRLWCSPSSDQLFQIQCPRPTSVNSSSRYLKSIWVGNIVPVEMVGEGLGKSTFYLLVPGVIEFVQLISDLSEDVR